MKWNGHSQLRHRQGFTLVEVVIAMLITGIVVWAVISVINFNRVQAFKDKERGLVLDYCVHYLELVRGMPFDDLKASAPINKLFDGSGGSPDIRIPASTNWISLTNLSYLLFHPELAQLVPRAPEMRASLQTTQQGGVDHTKLLSLEVQWDSPLQRGQRHHARLDMFRSRDIL